MIMNINKLCFRLLNALDAFTARIHWLFSEERRNPYRCPMCGGTDIHVRAWIRPNFSNRYAGDCEDFPEGACDWCESCRKKIEARTTDWFKQMANEWWSQTDFPTKERITGLRQTDFSAEEGYQDFVDASNAHWNALPIERQISIQYEVTHQEHS